MNFKLISYFPVVLTIFVLIVLIIYLYEKRYFKWIYKHWFYKKSGSNLFRNFFYFLSIGLFLLSALDLRGPSQKIDSKIPDQKTVVIIDASASMLAEDIKPNRFEKAILIARHFVSKAYGHQISVVVFSDIKRKIVPFTDDVNILDARIDALRDLDIRRGSSNIGIALMEAVQDIKTEAGELGEVAGNILLLTDSEGSDKDIDLAIPKGINLAIVGVGTRVGANIPIRDKEDRLTGFKQLKGEKIISKLDEDYIKKIGSKAKSFRYWVTSSYNMPTEEILAFFKQSFVSNLKNGSLNVEPVLTYKLIIIAIIFFCLSIFCSFFSSFKIENNTKIIIFIFFIFLSLERESFSQEDPKVKKTNPEIENSLNRISSGDFNQDEKIKLAKEYLDIKQYDKSNILYDEYIRNQKDPNAKVVFNYATSKIASGDISGGLELYRQIQNSDDIDKDKMRKNIFLALEKKKQQEKKQQDKKDKKEDKQDQSKTGSGDKSDKDDNKKNGNQEQKESSGNQKKDNQENKDKSEKNEQKNKDKQDQNDKEKNEGQDQQKSLEEKLKEKEKGEQNNRKDMKLHGMIKQLLNEDKDLQRQYMDPRIDNKNNKKNSDEEQDW